MFLWRVRRYVARPQALALVHPTTQPSHAARHLHRFRGAETETHTELMAALEAQQRAVPDARAEVGRLEAEVHAAEAAFANEQATRRTLTRAAIQHASTLTGDMEDNAELVAVLREEKRALHVARAHVQQAQSRLHVAMETHAEVEAKHKALVLVALKRAESASTLRVQKRPRDEPSGESSGTHGVKTRPADSADDTGHPLAVVQAGTGSVGSGSASSAAAPTTAGAVGPAAPPATVLTAASWLGEVVHATRNASVDPKRAAFASRVWNPNRSFTPEATLLQGFPAGEPPTSWPLILAAIVAEPARTKDAEALRATSVAPTGSSRVQQTRWQWTANTDERQAIRATARLSSRARTDAFGAWPQALAGMRNMFMQSGIPGALHLTMIVIPAMGLCVWLAIALIHARYAARAAQREEPRLLDTCGVLVELHQLVEPFSSDACLAQTVCKLESVDARAWDQVDGDGRHYGQALDACEVLAAHLNVYIPVFVLARLEDHSGFNIALLFVGDISAPNAFGPRGGAVVTYDGGPRVTHVDLLVPE